VRGVVFSSVPRIPFAQRAPRTHVLDVHMCVTQNSLRHLKQCGWRILLDPLAKGMFSRIQTSAKTADASKSQATLSRACLGNMQTPRDQALLRLRSVATTTAQEGQRWSLWTAILSVDKRHVLSGVPETLTAPRR
jgi:hypothetical protein